VEQLDMFLSSAKEDPSKLEREFFEDFCSLLKDSDDFAMRNVGLDDITFNENKTYSVVKFRSFLAFRLHLRGKKYYIAVPTIVSKELSANNDWYQIKSEPSFIRIPLYSVAIDKALFSDILLPILLSTIDRCQKEFDCCSRYLDCSNAKMCIHPDPSFAIKCGYKKTLESGTIFFGKNRNVV